ncbi:hypothetical protein BDV93DRAFT_606111 [Ceratobasidium sp. AG-I]|nr:hypothetical protein BDV93DRAFT_606111 [Ceratobasidium sp. AG-I]
MPPASQNDFKFEPRLENEEEWVARFTDAMDSLDWVRWGPYWSNGAFLQFGNAPKQVGNEIIGQFVGVQKKLVKKMTHRTLRCSYDSARGLIYQSAILTYRVNGDTQDRTTDVPALAVIHKQIGEEVITGMEIFVDRAPVMEIVKEVMAAAHE